MQRGSMTAELHFKPNGIPDGSVGEDIRTFFREAEQAPVLVIGLRILPLASAQL